MRTLLKGGSVVSAAGVKRADVLIDGEKIARVSERPPTRWWTWNTACCSPASSTPTPTLT